MQDIAFISDNIDECNEYIGGIKQDYKTMGYEDLYECPNIDIFDTEQMKYIFNYPSAETLTWVNNKRLNTAKIINSI